MISVDPLHRVWWRRLDFAAVPRFQRSNFLPFNAWILLNLVRFCLLYVLTAEDKRMEESIVRIEEFDPRFRTPRPSFLSFCLAFSLPRKRLRVLQ